MRKTIVRAAVLSLIIVSTLTYIGWTRASAICFYLLYPGAIMALFISSPHGGTRIQDWAALIASVLVNTLAYTIAFYGTIWIWRRISLHP